MLRRLRSTTPIAVDLGTSSFRAIQLDRNGRTPTIRHWLNQPLPARQDDGQEDSGDQDQSLPGLSLARLSDLSGFEGRRIVASLGPPDVDVCSLKAPEKLMGQEQDVLIRSLRHEVARHVQIPIETAELAVWPLPPVQVDGPNLMVAAAPKAMIRQFLEWVDAQGCVCVGIDLAPLAMMRACLRVMSDLETEGLWGVLDVGARSSRFYLGLDETPVYVRSLPASGDMMTRRIANELGVEPAMAERYKRHYGIRAEGGGYRPMLAQQGPIDDKRMANILLGALSPIVRGMAQDIEKSFRYAMDLYPGRRVSHVVLAGGGCRLDGLPELLGKLLGIPVRRACADRLVAASRHHPALAADVLVEMVTCLGLSYGEYN